MDDFTTMVIILDILIWIFVFGLCCVLRTVDIPADDEEGNAAPSLTANQIQPPQSSTNHRGPPRPPTDQTQPSAPPPNRSAPGVLFPNKPY